MFINKKRIDADLETIRSGLKTIEARSEEARSEETETADSAEKREEQEDIGFSGFLTLCRVAFSIVLPWALVLIGFLALLGFLLMLWLR